MSLKHVVRSAERRLRDAGATGHTLDDLIDSTLARAAHRTFIVTIRPWSSGSALVLSRYVVVGTAGPERAVLAVRDAHGLSGDKITAVEVTHADGPVLVRSW